MSTKTIDEKKAFARKCFEQLREEGFSRRVAGDIMRAAGPRLAMKAVDWALLTWNAWCEREGAVDTREPLQVTRREVDLWVRGYFEGDSRVGFSTIRAKLIGEISSQLDGICQNPEDNLGNRMGMFHYARLSLPSTNRQEMIRILRAALVIIESIKY